MQKFPNLIIAGVHKAATTSLYTYLSYHYQIFCPDKKELHYFTPIRYQKPLQDIKKYAKYFDAVRDEKYLVDASPSYFYGVEPLIEKMNEVLPPHKVIVVLREPTQRFISYYNYLKAKLTLKEDQSFSDFVNECVKVLNEPIYDTEYHRAIREGQYIDFLPAWIDAYGNDFKIVYFEDLVTNPEKVMVDLAGWLNIDAAPFKDQPYTNENKTVYIKNKILHSAALFINYKMEGFWRRNKKIKQSLRDVYYLFNKKPKQGKQVDDEGLNKLKHIYGPSNEKLERYIKEHNLQMPGWL